MGGGGGREYCHILYCTQSYSWSCTSVCTVPGVARLPSRTCDILTVACVPITGRVIAGLVTVVVSDPIGRASLCTVGHRPGEVDLGGRGERG